MAKLAKKKVVELRENADNPRTLDKDAFAKLKKSLQDFPEMLEARPIVVNPDNVVLGGNMRLKAAKEIGLETVPVYVASWEESKQRQFIIKDNVAFGAWDFDVLANEWDAAELADWGLDVWQDDTSGLDDIEIPEHKQEEPYLGYDRMIQIKLSNEQFEQVFEGVKAIVEDAGATVDVS